MNNFDRLLKLTEDDKVELASEMKQLLHTELVLGQTRYVCRYGTLSDGHEKITPAQRYYQANKEIYYLGLNIRQQKAQAKLAQADLLDAQEQFDKATKPADKLRAEAKVEIAQEAILTSLVTVQDQLRMLDEYSQVRQELLPVVRAQYPLGIEQAEQDSWSAVAEYRAKKRQIGIPETMTNLPLEPQHKAKLGLQLGAPDLTAWLAVADSSALNRVALEASKEHLSLVHKGE